MSKKIIYGDTVGTPVARPDWAEENERSAAYIKNKPTEDIEKNTEARHTHDNQELLDNLTEDMLDGGTSLPVAYINDNGELILELSGDIRDAEINSEGELELKLETENGEKAIVLGKVRGRTPEFRLTEKILEIKYDDETTWNTLVDFSTIASTFDLRLNEETYFLEAQREVDGEWAPMVDLSALKLAHEHANKAILDKLTKYDLENIGDIPAIVGDIDNLSVEVDELASRPLPEKQLVEGFYGKGLSANKDTIPTGDAWIEIGASTPLYCKSQYIISKELKVVTETVNKTTTTKVSIDITWNYAQGAQEYFNKLMNNYYSYASVVFADETDKTYYIALSKNNCSIIGTTISLQFTFLSDYDTFPITTPTTRVIDNIRFYITNGMYSHSEGDNTKAVGQNAHAEGGSTIASGNDSHAEGTCTIASGENQHVQGKYNIEDAENKYAHIVGNGTSDSNRSNAHTVDWEGNAWYASSVESNIVAFSPDFRGGDISGRPIGGAVISANSNFVTINPNNYMYPNKYYLVKVNDVKHLCWSQLNGSTTYILDGIDENNSYSGFYISYSSTDGKISVYEYDHQDIERQISIYEVISYNRPTNLLVAIERLKSKISSLEAGLDEGVTQSEMETYVTAAINGTLDEIETMIDESGVLDE